MNTHNISRYIESINRPLHDNKKSNLTSISLFSGIMGIELGFARAGFKTLLCLDIDKHAKDVIEENRVHMGKFPYLTENIYDIEPESLLKQIGVKSGNVSLLAGGPPCQPFSKSGLRKGTTDEKGELFKRYLDYIHVIKPAAFILENVRGLYSSRGGKDFELVLRHFDDTGYTVYWTILDAASFGVPQFRQRLFLVGFRERLRFVFPQETHHDPSEINSKIFTDYVPFVTSLEAIGDLADKVTAPVYSGRYSHLLAAIPEGLNYSFYTKERGHPSPVFEWRSQFWYFLQKLDRNRPSLTIQAQPGNNTGPFHWRNRKLAIEELKRLQSFPDWLTINKPYMIAHRLIGNAVPPLLAETLGVAIRESLAACERISALEHQKIRLINEQRGKYVKSGRGSGKGKLSFEQAH